MIVIVTAEGKEPLRSCFWLPGLRDHYERDGSQYKPAVILYEHLRAAFNNLISDEPFFRNITLGSLAKSLSRWHAELEFLVIRSYVKFIIGILLDRAKEHLEDITVFKGGSIECHGWIEYVGILEFSKQEQEVIRPSRANKGRKKAFLRAGMPMLLQVTNRSIE